jgi:hypothetical protein
MFVNNSDLSTFFFNIEDRPILALTVVSTVEDTVFGGWKYALF